MTLLSAGIINGQELPIPTDSLEAFYPLTPSTVTPSVATDQSGNGNDIDRHGVSIGPDGATFDGVDDYFGPANLGAATNIDVTLSAWLSTDPDQRVYASLSDEMHGAAFVVAGYFPAVDDYRLFIDGDFDTYTGLGFNSGTHVIFKKNSSGWEIKLDNAVYSSGSLTGSFHGDIYLTIGAFAEASKGRNRSNFYSGTQHDVALYSKHTTDAEDTQLYNNPSI